MFAIFKLTLSQAMQETLLPLTFANKIMDENETLAKPKGLDCIAKPTQC